MLLAPAMPENARDARHHPEPQPAGTRGAAGARRGARRQRAAGLLHRRAARDGREGEQGPGPGRARQLRLRPSVRAHHRQPRAGRPAEGRRSLRPADRGRHPGRVGAAATRAFRQDRALRRAVAGRRPACDSWRASDRTAGNSRRAHADTAGRQHGRSGARTSWSHPRSAAPARRLQVCARPAATRIGWRAGACGKRDIRAGPRRRSRAGARATRPRDCCGRRAQPADDRTARRRQEHARAAPAGDPAGDDRGRGARDGGVAVPDDGGFQNATNGGGVRSARRTTPLPRSPSWAAAHIRVLAKSRWPTTACCSSTSCRSSTATCSRSCASRSSPVTS